MAEPRTRPSTPSVQTGEELFLAAHEASPDPFAIFEAVRDGTGSIIDFEWVYVNPAAGRMLGYPPGALVGNRVSILPGVREHGDFFERCVEIVESGEARKIERYFDAEGGGGWFRYTMVRVGDGLAISSTEITDRKKVEEELRRARDKAEEGSRAKSRFLAVMSHELRTPLNAVLGFGELLETGIAGPLNEVQKQHIARIQRSGRHLLELINQVLTFSRIDAGKERIFARSIDAGALARDTVSFVEPLAAKKGIGFRFVDAEGPLPLETDPGKLRQVLLNLLGNAIKFTDRGGVELRIGRQSDGIAFEVRDTGPGIAPADLHRIFEPFTQVHDAPTRLKDGTGLGLTVSRHLVHLLGGEISLDSELDRGSTFTIWLPLRSPNAAPMEP